MGRKNKRRKSSYSRKMKINPKKLIMRQQNTYEAKSNWQPLCKACHDRKTWREDNRPTYTY